MAQEQGGVRHVAPVDDENFEPPTLGRRFGALLVDWLLCLLVSYLFGDPTRQAWLTVAVLILEYALFIGLFTQTPGMWLTRLRCVSYADGGRIGVPRALLRGLLLALVVPAMIMDVKRRGMHDWAAGSIMVPAARPAPEQRSAPDQRG